MLDAAVERAYRGARRISWEEVLAGEKAFRETGEWLPPETAEAFRRHVVGIEGPPTTPVGGGIRSLNVALRRVMDLHACVRPVRWHRGVPSAVRHPEQVDMVIVGENTEDIHAGNELEAGSEVASRLLECLRATFGWEIRPGSGTGIKPISGSGTRRPVRTAIRHALDHRRRSVTLVHEGKIMKFTGGAFRARAYRVAAEKLPGRTVSWGEHGGRPGDRLPIRGAVADALLQQVLTRAAEYDVIATMNPNGDCISDGPAVQVGGIGIGPGGNVNHATGLAVFEATHGTASPPRRGDKVTPGLVVPSGALMFRYLGWAEAASLVEWALEATIDDGVVTCDLARLMSGVTRVKTSEFASAMIERM